MKRAPNSSRATLRENTFPNCLPFALVFVLLAAPPPLSFAQAKPTKPTVKITVPAQQGDYPSAGAGFSFVSVNRIGGTAIDRPSAAAVDASGNLYLAGTFGGTVDFGADYHSSDKKTSQGFSDGFVTKMHANGSYAWTKRFGGKGNDWIGSLALAPNGDVLLLGSFSGDVNFAADFGKRDRKRSIKDKQVWSRDVFVTALTKDGQYRYTHVFGGPGDELDHSIKVAANGHVFLLGTFRREIDFKRDFGGHSIRKPKAFDLFLVELNESGGFETMKDLGGRGFLYETTLGLDAAANLFIGGTGYVVDFATDFGSKDERENSKFSDFFLSKFRTGAKEYAYTKRIGGPGHEFSPSLAVDAPGNAYLTGLFQGEIDFAADFGSHDLKKIHTPRKYNSFVSKILPNGAYGFTRVFSGQEYGFYPVIATDALGNIFAGGRFVGSANFAEDFGGTATRSALGLSDAFVLQMTSIGAYRDVRTFGGPNHDMVTAITPDNKGNLYVVGSFIAEANFQRDFGGSATRVSLGNEDIFIVKLRYPYQ